MFRVWTFLAKYSIQLIAGALIALVWVNIDPDSYHGFIEFPLYFGHHIGSSAQDWLHENGLHFGIHDIGDASRVLTVHYLINDVLMAFFFASAAKEVWEAVILQNGSLRGRKAATPLLATLGGMCGPVIVYLALASVLGSSVFDAVHRGWAIPTATDIAFSYLVGRLVFGAGHPAVRFLLLLAIADDAAGLVILAIFYPSGDLAASWLLLSLAAAVTVFVLFNWLPRRLDAHDQKRPTSTWVRTKLSFWPYLLAGAVSWYAFQRSGIHAALGLLPIIPAIPHADRAFGVFADAQKYLTDLLNQISEMVKHPVEIILFFFGLTNAGVELQSIGIPTWLVLAGLLIGKPMGIFAMGCLAAYPLKLGLPTGMRTADLFVVGCVAAIGFTVSLFIASVAFEPGPVQDAAKMGALFSFAAAGMSFVAGKFARVEKRPN